MYKTYWFKITKWNTNKPDFCRVRATNEKEAKYKIEDQLLIKKSLTCDYFSTFGKYGRKIDDIINFELVDQTEVQKHIDRINFAIEKQEEEELTLSE